MLLSVVVDRILPVQPALDAGPLAIYERKGSYSPPTAN